MNHKFSKNNKYYTIALYAIAVITISAIIIRLIMNWDSTSKMISSILEMLHPFIMGLFIAYFLNPLVKTINQKLLKPLFKEKAPTVRKIIAILLSYIIVIGLIVTILFYIIPQIVDSLKQITLFIESAQSGYQKVMDKLLAIEAKHPEWDLSVVNETVKDIPDKFIDFVTNAIPSIIPTIYTTSMSFISGVLNALIAIMVSIYMLIDKHQLINNCKRFIYAVLGEKRGDHFLNTSTECNRIFSNFIVGKLIDSLIIGLICFMAMTLLQLPYALMISVIVGVTNMIPYFGPFIGAVPGILLLMFVDLKYAIIFTILIIILQQFDGLILGPKILGETTGLRPIWIIFAITAGGSVGGILGMFLGVPVTAVIAYLLNNFIEKHLGKKEISFHTDPNTGVMTRQLRGLPLNAPAEDNTATAEENNKSSEIPQKK
jgi:predicted PurR-regulated permease PerM